MQITAAVLEKADGALTRRNIKPEAVELEDPRADEDLIKVTSRGVCGTVQGIIKDWNLSRPRCPRPRGGGHRRGDRRQRRPRDDHADPQDAIDPRRRGTMPQDPRE